jgi:thioredoxin-dependent peroxiredoxin
MLKALFFLVLAVGLSAAYLLTTGHAEPLAQGAKAPTDAISDQDGKPFDLAAAYKKGLTLVYFYPKADTPGCTKQACSLRDENKALIEAGIQIIGVSINTPKEQKDFQEKYKLPFTLLADEQGKIVAGFGVPKMVIGFAKRQSFLVKDGLIVWSDPDVSPATHTAKVLEAAAKLK